MLYSMWHECTDWNCDRRKPERKPSKQSGALQFSVKLSILTIMSSSSQQNQSSHLSHVIIPFWGENLRPGCDFSIKASGLSGLACVLEPEIERRISAVMTCLCLFKKGSVSLLSMNCVLIHVQTELSLWDYTHTHTEIHTIRQNPDSARLIHMPLFWHTPPTYTHTPLLSISLLYFLTSQEIWHLRWGYVSVCVFVCNQSLQLYGNQAWKWPPYSAGGPLGSSSSSPDKELFGHLLRAELRLVHAAGGGQGVWQG